MKKTSLSLLILFLMAMTGWAQQATITHHPDTDKKAEVTNGPIAKFDTTVINLGDIPQGIPRTAEFVLNNKGNEPLIISYAKASCGCTNLSYSKEPILPGKSIPISVTYNAAAPGNFIKAITIRTNADENQVVLQIRGTVIKKEEPAPAATTTPQ